RRIRQRGKLMLIGGTAFGVMLMLFASSRALWLSVLLLGLAGCAMIVNNSLTNTLLQTAVPDELRGRIMGFYSFVFVGMAPFGAFFVGLAAEHYGAPLAVGAGGLVCVLGVALAAWRVPELREA
ncbi:MAG TPA: MFS transporter, partial [Gemmatimonadales bacterium]|nr:MFS transporter [Gemmatimonadales bacterium]